MIIELVWESLIEQQRKYNVAVHFVDSAGRILWNDDYAHSTAVKGAVWLDTIKVPIRKLEGVEAVGLCIYDANEKLKVDSGNSDWNGYRLLLPINYSPFDAREKATTRKHDQDILHEKF